MALIGLSGGVEESTVTASVSISQLAGIAGAFFAGIAIRWMSQANLLILGCLGCILPLLFLAHSFSWADYAVAVFVFNGAANIITPLVVSIAVRTGSGDVMAQICAALQMGGLAIGPAVAGIIIAEKSYPPLLFFCAILFSATLLSGRFAIYRSKAASPGG